MEGRCVDQLPEDASEQEWLTTFYFDQDYMFVNSSEALQRYISIFEGTQVLPVRPEPSRRATRYLLG